MRHYYAMSDSFAGDNPVEYTHGFANMKTALAFQSKTERDAWLSETKLLTAKAITRKEAMRLCERNTMVARRHPSGHVPQWEDICPIYGTGEDYDSRGRRVYGTGEYLVLAESAN